MLLITWSIDIRSCGNWSGSLQVSLQLFNLGLQCSYTVFSQRHTEIIVTTNDSLDNCLCSFVGISFNKVWNGRDITRSSDHLLDCGTLVRLAKAGTASIMSRSNDLLEKGVRNAPGSTMRTLIPKVLTSWESDSWTASMAN